MIEMNKDNKNTMNPWTERMKNATDDMTNLALLQAAATIFAQKEARQPLEYGNKLRARLLLIAVDDARDLLAEIERRHHA